MEQFDGIDRAAALTLAHLDSLTGIYMVTDDHL